MEAIYNFRDFGGYKTENGLVMKKGLLYRSASLANASQRDLAELASLGIRTICDLRTPKEMNDNPDRFLAEMNVKYLHLPIKVLNHNESGPVSQLFSLLFGKARRLNYAEVTLETYREFAADFRPVFSEVIKLAADSSNLPILIHCTAGKDRTGFACSLIQYISGVPHDAAQQDYLMSNDNLSEFRDQMLNRLKALSIFGVSRDRFLPLLEARTEYLEAAYDQIRRDYGSVEAYVSKGLDISDEDRRKLNHLLLEKKPR